MLLLSVSVVIFLLWILKKNVVVVRKNSKNNLDVIRFILAYPFIFVTFISLAISIPFLKLFRNFVGLILKIKLKDEYHDTVKGFDALMCAADVERCYIKAMLILEHDKSTTTKTLFTHIKDLLEEKRYLLHDKFFTVLDESMGYMYFKNTKIEISDILKKLPLTKNELSTAELANIINKSFSKDFPLNETALWDIHVGTQPLKWRENLNPDIEYYPLLIRFHHVIADGATLITVLRSILTVDQKVKIGEPQTFNNEETNVQKVITEVTTYFNTFVYFPSATYINTLLKAKDSNEIVQKEIPDSEVFQFNTDENGVYFKKVKKIKKLVSNTSFPEIVITAFTASLNDYFQKHCSSVPDFVGVTIPVLLDHNILKGILSEPTDMKDISVKNHFTFVTLNAPLDISKNNDFDSNKPLTSRLKIINNLTNNLKDSCELQFTYIFFHYILGLLPIGIIKKVLGKMSTTSATSLLPGPKRFSGYNDVFTVSDCMFWLPSIIRIGISFTTLTLDDRLQMGTNCKCKITKQSEASEILDGVYKHIDLIEKEVDNPISCL